MQPNRKKVVYIGEGQLRQTGGALEDIRIIELFWRRDESAIAEASAKYNGYCMQIAMNILASVQDSEECVNDAYLAAWNSIPPNSPDKLSVYLGKLTRNLSLNRYKAQNATKRGGGEFAVSLDELDECIADAKIEQEELGKLISDFLYTQPKQTRQVFVRRYFYSDSISDITKRFEMSESKVKSMLHRTRQGLRKYLEEQGVSI